MWGFLRAPGLKSYAAGAQKLFKTASGEPVFEIPIIIRLATLSVPLDRQALAFKPPTL